MGVSGRHKADGSPRHIISIESQILAISCGFIALIVASAIFVAIRRQRGRRLSRDCSPLISHAALKPNYLKGERLPDRSAFPIQSPGSGSSSSPQCTPMTPYSSFVTQNVLMANKAETAEDYNDRGSISLNMNFDQTSNTLQLSILACHNLPNLTNERGQCALNPYVKLRVLPDNHHRVKTRVLRGTQNPFYDEQFTLYGLNAEKLESYTLHLAVLGSDPYSRDTVLGEAFYNLRDANFSESSEKLNLDLKLSPRPCYNDLHAEVLVSISYNSHSNNLNVAIIKMKDLPVFNGMGQIDAYAKIYLLLDGQRVAKQKTHVKKKSNEPVFNESFSFEIPSINGEAGHRLRSAEEMLSSLSLEVMVLNHDGVTRNEIVGQCFIGPRSEHWKAMIEGNGQQVADWHKVNPI
ncbi:unnamed protein product [Bursaphelenchus xylophilus]|uniref:(pine wood nematode) hypothetical protein n=1 Tax=Bursaphelenchus xylophilus TaxID=6326 RepID=A0A1I7S7H2_BURXY|nr:unnamed protein product [Bursaphelenchus xylophilus]CAG9085090.1 unnamed protein product [Bursaphelenchus xylophilus]